MTRKLLIVVLVLSSFLFAQSQESGIIYLSFDEGQSWQRTDSGLPDDALANDFLLFRNTLFTATEKHGVYRSDDGGKCWRPTNFGLRSNQKVDALAANGSTIFAGTYEDGIYLSLDGGQSWLPANHGLTNLTIRSLDVQNDLIYAGTSDGLFISSDNGRNWRQLTSEMQINRLIFKADQLFLATNKGILLSKDQGENWQRVYKEGAIRDLTAHGTGVYALTFNAQVLRTTDGGQNWLQFYADAGDFTATLLSLGSQLFTSRLSGLFFSYSNGLSWEKVPTKLPFFKQLKRLGDGTLIAASSVMGVDGC